MGQINSCPRCGATLADTMLDGLCPACAAAAVLSFARYLLDTPVSGLGVDAARPRPTDFGEFELIEEIARGGMGVVYKARQKRLNRLVALKMILSGRFAGDEQVKRFRAEAEAAASLRHPNIVAIHDVGEVAGQHYFCMDLIEGPNLNRLIRDHPIPYRKAALLVQEVAHSVQYAHEHGVVHRDLKPSNIIIDPEGRPHVTDFGLAKRLGGESDLTQSGEMLGSPNFAAPEQAAGRSHEAGPRCDVYSLGAIFYFLLVGRPPFVAGSLEQTLSMVLANDPIALRKLDPGIPRDLETICLKCLEKDPGKRYATAGLLAQELGRFLNGEPILARPIGAPEKLLRWTRRNRTVAVLVALVAMLLVLGTSGVFWQWQRAKRSAHDEHQQRTRAEATVTELQSQHAEQSLDQGDAYRALVHLAQMLRQSPTNRAVAERMISVLSQRRFPLPISPPLPHAASVRASAFSNDGSRVATASADGTAVVWDTADGRRLVGPLRHEAPVNAIQFSPDGALVLTGAEDGGIRLWDAETGMERVRFQNESNAIAFIEFDPQGRFIIGATRNQRATVWRVANGERVFPPIAHASQVTAARFSPAGDRFLTASSADALVRVFDTFTGREIHSFKFNGWILSARFSPDGRRIAVASYGNWASIWTPGGTPSFVTVRHDDVVNDAALSPDGLLLATVSRDRRALVWDSRTGDLVFSLPTQLTWVEQLAFGPEGLTLMTRELANRVVVWDLLNGGPFLEPIQSLTRLNGAVSSPDGGKLMLNLADGTSQIWRAQPASIRPLRLQHPSRSVTVDFARDGRRLVAGMLGGETTVYDAVGGLPLKTFRHQGWVNSVQFSPDGSKVLSASSDKRAVVWDWESGATVSVQHDLRVNYAEFSPDGHWFVTASFDGTARTWSAETGAPVSEPMRHPGRLWRATFSPDSRLVATACDDTRRGTDHHARIWESRSGKPVTPALRHAHRVKRVAFDPTGAILATASADNTAVLWAVPSGQRLREIKHTGPIGALAFSPAGRYLATSSSDGTAQVWDIQTGQPSGERLRHPGEVGAVAWSRDGRRLATAYVGGAVRVWDPRTGRPATEPLWHPGHVRSIQFSPDGRRLACAAPRTCLWDLPRVEGQPPAWLPELAEAVAGILTRSSPSQADVGVGDLYELGKRLTAKAAHDPMQPWARWFFQDRFVKESGPPEIESASEEPFSDEEPPSSEAPLEPESVAASEDFGDKTIASTVEALHANPTNAAAWRRLFKQTRAQRSQDNPLRDAQAEYYSRKTVALNPGALTNWLERAEWLNASKRTEMLPEMFEAAFQHHPADPELSWVRAKGLDEAGRLAEAAAAYRTVLDQETNRLADRFMRSANRRRGLLRQLGDPERAQQEWLKAMGIVARAENLSGSCIDLSTHYNAAFHEPWLARRWRGNDLAHVAPGRMVTREVTFDVRGVIQLGGIRLNQSEPGFPDAVNGILINRACDKLHFLHAAAWVPFVPDGTLVSKCVVHYADGATETVHFKKSVDLHDWSHTGPAPLADLAGARTIDLGRNAARIRLRLFLKTWQNPRSTIPIATIDFVSEVTTAAPFLVGLTVEP